MLVDGINFTSNSNLTNIKAEPVTSLPTTDKRDGRIVALTVTVGSFNPGLYICFNSTWTLLTEKSYVDTQIAASKIYDIASGVTSKPAANAVVMTFKTPRAFSIPANFAGSQSTAGVAGSGSSAVFTIKKNGTQCATFSFGIGSSVATFSTQGPISFDTGDLMTITGPSAQNATLADIYWSIAATLTTTVV